MTFRDLTPQHSIELQHFCSTKLTERNKSRPPDRQFNSLDFKLAFSDGVLAILQRLPYLPDLDDKSKIQ